MTETEYTYACPVCHKETASVASMCAHIINVFDPSNAHWNWMKEHGINLIDIVGTYKPLMEVVKEECKPHKHEIEKHVIHVKGRKPTKDKVIVIKGRKPVKNKVLFPKRQYNTRGGEQRGY